MTTGKEFWQKLVAESMKFPTPFDNNVYEPLEMHFVHTSQGPFAILEGRWTLPDYGRDHGRAEGVAKARVHRASGDANQFLRNWCSGLHGCVRDGFLGKSVLEPAGRYPVLHSRHRVYELSAQEVLLSLRPWPVGGDGAGYVSHDYADEAFLTAHRARQSMTRQRQGYDILNFWGV